MLFIQKTGMDTLVYNRISQLNQHCSHFTPHELMLKIPLWYYHTIKLFKNIYLWNEVNGERPMWFTCKIKYLYFAVKSNIQKFKFNQIKIKNLQLILQFNTE